MKKIELLAPAGDFERLKFSLLYGADAVYIGGQDYSLRANANNFSIEEIKNACLYAHNLNKKVYLTLNIVFHNEDIKGVNKFIKEVVDAGIDAFIVSDPFMIKHIKDNYDVEVHLSTQGSTTNKESVLYWKNEGIDRVVLAREVSIDEIKEIYDYTKLDLEVFIHGAMCTFYSGRCCLSNYFTNRDSNRGGCAQICRFCFDTETDKENKFTMATKDLNMSKLIKDLIAANIKSLKVEGRMRSIYYLASVMSSYRKIIDSCYNDNFDIEELMVAEKVLDRVANRETSTHYYLKEADYTDQYYSGRQELSNQDFLALVLEDSKDGLTKITQRNYFKINDEVEIFTPDGRIIPFVIENIYDEKMNHIEIARHPEEILYIKTPKNIPANSMMRIRI